MRTLFSGGDRTLTSRSGQSPYGGVGRRTGLRVRVEGVGTEGGSVQGLRRGRRGKRHDPKCRDHRDRPGEKRPTRTSGTPESPLRKERDQGGGVDQVM